MKQWKTLPFKATFPGCDTSQAKDTRGGVSRDGAQLRVFEVVGTEFSSFHFPYHHYYEFLSSGQVDSGTIILHSHKPFESQASTIIITSFPDPQTLHILWSAEVACQICPDKTTSLKDRAAFELVYIQHGSQKKTLRNAFKSKVCENHRGDPTPRSVRAKWDEVWWTHFEQNHKELEIEGFIEDGKEAKAYFKCERVDQDSHGQGQGRFSHDSRVHPHLCYIVLVLCSCLTTLIDLASITRFKVEEFASRPPTWSSARTTCLQTLLPQPMPVRRWSKALRLRVVRVSLVAMPAAKTLQAGIKLCVGAFKRKTVSAPWRKWRRDK